MRKQRAAGSIEEAVAYWETAAYLRWAAVAIQQGMRHTSGTEPSIELALTGRMLPEIEQDLLRHLDCWPAALFSGGPHDQRRTRCARAGGIALQTFRDFILPAVPAERRFEALMIANALSIAERELAAKPEPALADRWVDRGERRSGNPDPAVVLGYRCGRFRCAGASGGPARGAVGADAGATRHIEPEAA